MSIFPVNLGASIDLPAVGVVGINAGGQSFSTQNVVNNGLALYTLSIRQSASPFSVISSYTFPISPAAITKDFSAMSMYYDTQGSSQESGVHREFDIYGNSPPSFLIEGTTGWQRHSTDGFAFTGMQSVALLQSVLDQYAQINANLQAQGQADPCVLEFYDYFSNDYWSVVPVGKQSIRIARDRPLLYSYSFRLAGAQNLSASVQQPADPILDAFSTPSPQAEQTLQTQLDAVFSGYTSEGTS